MNFQIEALLCILVLNCLNTFVEDWLNVKISAIEKQVLHFLKEKHSPQTLKKYESSKKAKN